jgi:hypothetical protein
VKVIWYLALAILCGITAVCLIVVGYQFITGGMPRIGSLMLVSAALLFLALLEYESAIRLVVGSEKEGTSLKKLWCKIWGHRIYTDHIVMGVLCTILLALAVEAPYAKNITIDFNRLGTCRL